MPRLDARRESLLVALTRDVRDALGDDLVCLAVYGSAASEDFVDGRSDLNVAVVVPRVTLAHLEALAPVVGRYRRKGLAPPAIMDREYLQRARDIFPMELEDIRRAHRLLAGSDVFAGLVLDPAAIRRECETEARGKLLRLRALFVERGGRADPGLEALMTASLKSFLVVLRHWLALHGVPDAHDYRRVLAAGEAALGPLPAMRRLLAHREGSEPLPPAALRATFGAYLDDVERIVAAVDALDG